MDFGCAFCVFGVYCVCVCVGVDPGLLYGSIRLQICWGFLLWLFLVILCFGAVLILILGVRFWLLKGGSLGRVLVVWEGVS